MVAIETDWATTATNPRKKLQHVRRARRARREHIGGAGNDAAKDI